MLSEKPKNKKDMALIDYTVMKSKAKLRDEVGLYGNEILIIPKKKKVKVLEFSGKSYWKIMYKESVGYINEIFLIKTENMISAKHDFENKQNEKSEEKRHLRILKEYGENIGIRIINNEIWLGMTKDMASESIGWPTDVNKTTGSWGVHEQWVYDKEGKYLYFENGILTSWQD